MLTGAATVSISVLQIYKPTFDLAASLAGLVLKAKKCVLVSVAAPFSVKADARIKEWLLKNIWDWRDFNVLPCGTYLGFLMGPAAGTPQWDKTLAKYALGAKAVFIGRQVASKRFHLGVPELRLLRCA